MYPKRKYHRGGGFVEVTDKHHEKALGEDWHDNPPFVPDPVEPEPLDESKDDSKKKSSRKPKED